MNSTKIYEMFPLESHEDMITLRELSALGDARERAYRARAATNDITTIIQQFGQWAVTDYGLESLDTKYDIEKSRLWEDEHGGWIEHMLGKNWVVPYDFVRAFEAARRYHYPRELAELEALVDKFNRKVQK